MKNEENGKFYFLPGDKVRFVRHPRTIAGAERFLGAKDIPEILTLKEVWSENSRFDCWEVIEDGWGRVRSDDIMLVERIAAVEAPGAPGTPGAPGAPGAPDETTAEPTDLEMAKFLVANLSDDDCAAFSAWYKRFSLM